MRLFRWMGARRPECEATARERSKLAQTMPGQTAALAANRLGVFAG